MTAEIQELPPVTVNLGGWYLYYCMRDDEVTSIAVDLTFGSDAVSAELPWLTIVKIELHAPVNGLASGGEAVLLDEMQERFESELNGLGQTFVDRLLKRPAPKFRYVARVTSAGSRRLYFYGTAPVPASVYKRVFAVPKFDEYNCGSFEQREPDHATWRDELHPGPALNPLVLSNAQVAMRKEQGDQLAVAREVEHRIEFDSRDACQQFVAFMQRDTTGTLRIEPDDDGLGVTITSTHSVDTIWTNVHVSAFAAHAHKFGGRYDGWGALVVPD